MLPKSYLFFAIVYFVSDSYGQRAQKFFRKDYTYIDATESFYKFHATPRTWEDAKRICEIEASILFYPENEEEARAVLSFWKKTRPIIIKAVWIGMSDSLIEGVFETVDGKSISEVYSNWVHSEPNNSGGDEDCVNFEQSGGKFNDYNCNTRFHFFCKKSLETLEWNNNCNMPNLDYTFSRDTGKCYKLHATPLNWNDAYAICQLEQSKLAMINNKAEADYLVKFTVSTPKPRVKGKHQRGIYHLGFHNKLKQGWQTVKGTPINVDGDAWFENYQPDDNENEECGAMFYTGSLINVDCGMKSFFICEHELDHINLPDSLSAEQALLHPYIGGGTK